MLSWGFVTEGVCARGGLMLRKQITKRVKGAEKNKRASKRANFMQTREPTVDRAWSVSHSEVYVFISLTGDRLAGDPNSIDSTFSVDHGPEQKVKPIIIPLKASYLHCHQTQGPYLR